MKTINFINAYIKDYYILIGKDEKKNIKKYDYILKDYYNDCDSFEQSEIKMQRLVIKNIINKNNLSDKDVDLIIGSDLNSQSLRSA